MLLVFCRWKNRIGAIGKLSHCGEQHSLEMRFDLRHGAPGRVPVEIVYMPELLHRAIGHRTFFSCKTQICELGLEQLRIIDAVIKVCQILLQKLDLVELLIALDEVVKPFGHGDRTFTRRVDLLHVAERVLEENRLCGRHLDSERRSLDTVNDAVSSQKNVRGQGVCVIFLNRISLLFLEI